MKKNLAVLITVLLLPVSLGAMDFGLILDQNIGLGGVGAEKPAFEYQANFVPRFSSLVGDPSGRGFGEFIITAGLTAGYDQEGYFIPELLRSEFSWRSGDAKITAGRMEYVAPSAYIAEGLFDGFQFLYDSRVGTFNAGAWYTGLLYKKKANILTTETDEQSFFATVDYDDFANTYFASRRMVAALDWEHPSVADLVRVKAAFIAQADLNRNRNNYKEDHLHSQYFTAKVGVPVESFVFELGGIIELAEIPGEFKVCLAGELGLFWIVPTEFFSRFSFTGYFSSGTVKDSSLAAFTPITAKTCGAVLEANPAGISVLSLDYTARLQKKLAAGLTSSYFIRSDLGTYVGYPVLLMENKGYFLGNEFFARLVWSPASDLQVKFGGGIFIPAMGNTAPDRAPQWRFNLAAVLALY